MNRASAKATSASGARKRAGLRPAIGTDDTRRFGRNRRRQASAHAGFAQALRLGPRGVRRGGAGGLVRVRDRARRADQAGGAAGRERRREVGDGPALRADARQEERRVRHQLAHAGEVLRHGRAGHGADLGRAPTRGPACRHRRRARRSAPTADRRPRARRRRSRRRRGWRCARGRTAPAPRAAGGLDERRQRVAAEQRVQRDGVGAEPGARRRTACRSRRTRPARRRAALPAMSPRLASAITSRPCARACAIVASSASQPGNPSRSKHASCGLAATQAGPAASISARQWPRTAAAASRRGRAAALSVVEGGGALDVGERHGQPGAGLGQRLDRVRPQLGRVGVDPQDDLGLALGDRPGEAVPERGGGRRLAGGRQSVARRPCYLTAFFRPEPAVKRGTLLAAICIVSPVRGLRPSRAPR